jgi:hypothetical protein
MDKLTELLEKLAIKLGTTVEHLWGVLVKQTKIVFWEYIGYTVLAVIFFISAIYFIKFSLDRLDVVSQYNMDKTYSSQKMDEIAPTVLLVFCIILVVAIPFVIIGNVKTIMTLKNNPEYWALGEVVGTINNQ